MATGDAMRLLVLIKQKETYIQRLRTLLAQAKKEGAADVFKINSEVVTATAQGKILVENYNELARLSKENQEYLIACAKRDERLALKAIRDHLNHHISRPNQED